MGGRGTLLGEHWAPWSRRNTGPGSPSPAKLVSAGSAASRQPGRLLRNGRGGGSGRAKAEAPAEFSRNWPERSPSGHPCGGVLGRGQASSSLLRLGLSAWEAGRLLSRLGSHGCSQAGGLCPGGGGGTASLGSTCPAGELAPEGQSLWPQEAERLLHPTAWPPWMSAPEGASPVHGFGVSQGRSLAWWTRP